MSRTSATCRRDVNEVSQMINSHEGCGQGKAAFATPDSACNIE